VTPKDKRKFDCKLDAQVGLGRGKWAIETDSWQSINNTFTKRWTKEFSRRTKKESDREGVEESVENMTNNENRNGDKECGEVARTRSE